MSAITHVGDSLLITRGEWRGCVAEVKEIKQLPAGLIDYVMVIDDSDEECVNKISITIPAEDCREYCPGSINLENKFDITNYLSVGQMRDIAKSIYEKKVSDYADEILNRRATAGCGSMADQILSKAADNFAKNLSDKYHDQMLVIFKKVIESDNPIVNDEDEKSFGRSIQWALERCATKYIEEHPEEICKIMEDEIAESAKQMINDNLSYNLTQAINKTANEVIGRYFNPDLYK
jgi:hypothetical protein